MKKLTLFLFFACLALFTLSAFTEANSQGYLKNSQSFTKDTIASNSANDTSYAFANPGYDDCYVEVIQNGVYDSYYINYPKYDYVRVRYVAADSSLVTEVYGGLGYIKVPIIVSGSSTQTSKYLCTLKTGNAVFMIRGFDRKN
jgi:hypothetical protein